MYLVFDIGGTNLRAGYSTDGQTFVQTKSVPTPQSYQDGRAAIIALGQELSGGKIEKTAIGIAGLVRDNQLIKTPNLPDWTGKPLAEDFFANFQVQPIIRNDAEMGGIGEIKFGAGQPYTSILYITIGTGMGGAWVQQEPLEAINLEPGQQTVDQTHHFDIAHFVSGHDLKLRFHRDMAEITDPDVWQEAAQHTALAIATNLREHPASAVILGGGMIIHDRISLEKIEQDLSPLLSYSPQPPLIKGALDDKAGLYGALSVL